MDLIGAVMVFSMFFIFISFIEDFSNTKGGNKSKSHSNSKATKLGRDGEAYINHTNKTRLDKNHYFCLSDLILDVGDGSTTQIDHIIVSCYGIFVIETKNMSGWIFGDAKSKQWTQMLYKKKYRFQNPIHQNYKHVKTLESILKERNIISLVVFVGDSKFKSSIPEQVFLKDSYIGYIKSFQKVKFSGLEVNKIVSSIRGSVSTKSSEEHIKSLYTGKRR